MPRNIQVAVFAASLSGLTAGCSPAGDPATQEPVELMPGLYQITLSGTGLAQSIQQGPGEAEGEICLRSGDVSRFPDRMARNYFSMHPGCTASPEPREGNAFRGKVSCPLDPREMTGEVAIDYEGVVSADRVVVTSRTKFSAQPVPGALSPEEQREFAAGSALMEMVGIQIKAVRAGDCA
jgi:hypothetical protein